MRKLLFLVAAAGLLAGAGCATDGGYVGGGYGYVLATGGHDDAGPADAWRDGLMAGPRPLN